MHEARPSAAEQGCDAKQRSRSVGVATATAPHVPARGSLQWRLGITLKFACNKNTSL
jgi:hypothetical protein